MDELTVILLTGNPAKLPSKLAYLYLSINELLFLSREVRTPDDGQCRSSQLAEA